MVLSRPTLCPARELLALDDDSLSRRWLDLQNERIDVSNNTIVQQLVLGTCGCRITTLLVAVLLGCVAFALAVCRNGMNILCCATCQPDGWP